MVIEVKKGMTPEDIKALLAKKKPSKMDYKHTLVS
jgi:hypothetical protein